VAAHVIYLVGGAPRVGKSSLAQRILAIDGIPWLPTDVIRTVVRQVAPEVDAIDQDPVDGSPGLGTPTPERSWAVTRLCADLGLTMPSGAGQRLLPSLAGPYRDEPGR
jgi:hypothetical protein